MLPAPVAPAVFTAGVPILLLILARDAFDNAVTLQVRARVCQCCMCQCCMELAAGCRVCQSPLPGRRMLTTRADHDSMRTACASSVIRPSSLLPRSPTALAPSPTLLMPLCLKGQRQGVSAHAPSAVRSRTLPIYRCMCIWTRRHQVDKQAEHGERRWPIRRSPSRSSREWWTRSCLPRPAPP